MSRRITVTTGARLHFGLFAQGGQSGRQFGGVGMMVGQPRFVLRAEEADNDEVLGDERWRERLLEVTRRYRSTCLPDRRPPPVRWDLWERLPAHAGLGSGTQLAMAVAAALAALAGESNVPPLELARRCGRGKRSAVGLHGFARGGLIVEAGKRSDARRSPLIAQTDIPAAWRFVLIRPRDAAGISGAEERDGFLHLAPMPASTTDKLCRLALLGLVPGAIEGEFDLFADALYEFGRVVGEYFAPVQGGVYADPRMRELAPRLRSRGIRGVGQSSWGPTLFAACPNADTAQTLVADLSRDPICENCELTIAEPLNRGALVEAGDH